MTRTHEVRGSVKRQNSPTSAVKRSGSTSASTVKKIISINEYAIEYYHQQLIAKKDKFQPVFDEWELSDEIIEKNMIGLADDDDDDLKLIDYLMSKGFTFSDITDSGLIKKDAVDQFYGRIIFPIFAKTGEPVSMAGRSYLSETERKDAVWLWLKNTPVFNQKDKNRCRHILAVSLDGHDYIHETFGQILNLGNQLNL